MKSVLKKFINGPLGLFDLEIKKKHQGKVRIYNLPTCIERLEHAKKLGFSPNIIFDGGAFKGLWSVAVNKLFPKAQIVLMEPNTYVSNTIKSNTEKFNPPAILEIIAIGEAEGESTFNIWADVDNDVGASLLDHVQGKAENIIKVKINTLDNICEKLNLKPDLIKLDLQGGELMALRGGSKVLKDTEFFIIEFGCLEAYKDRATPRDILDIMYENDYCLYDIVDQLYRPYDGALTGGDFFFVKNWSKLREYKGWK